MKTELDYWKKIAEAKIPGLTIKLGTYHTEVRRGNSRRYVRSVSSGEAHRAAAMLVVDARRAQGWLFTIEDYEDEAGRYTELSLWLEMPRLEPDLNLMVSTRDHDGKEHLALLALLAEVV